MVINTPTLIQSTPPGLTRKLLKRFTPTWRAAKWMSLQLKCPSVLQGGRQAPRRAVADRLQARKCGRVLVQRVDGRVPQRLQRGLQAHPGKPGTPRPCSPDHSLFMVGTLVVTAERCPAGFCRSTHWHPERCPVRMQVLPIFNMSLPRHHSHFGSFGQGTADGHADCLHW